MDDMLSGGIVLLASNASISASTIQNIDGIAIDALNGSSLDLENSTLKNISGTALLLYPMSTSSIISSHIDNSEGVEIYTNSHIDFENSDMKNISGTAFDIMGNSSVNINNSQIDSIDSGVEIYDSSSLDIENSTITNASSRWSPVFAIYTNSAVNITNSDIENIASEGFEIYGGGTLNFSSSTLKYMGKQALQAYANNQGTTTTSISLSDSIFSDGETNGMEIYGAVNADVKNSTIQNFIGDGVQVYSDPMPVNISNSSISGNNNGIETWGDFPPIEAVNNWWGDPSGPFNGDTNATGTANSVSDNVDFTPWLMHDPKIKRNPVIIIPGIGGSYLDTSNGTEVWPNVIDGLILPSDTYLDQLMLTQTGKIDSTEPIMTAKDAIRKIEFNLPIIGTIFKEDFFDGLINQLESNGYVEGQDLFVFSYDWRLDIRDDMPALQNKIDSIRQQTGSDKVDIIAHSMGGLLAKEYIKNYDQNEIGKFIDIATPHLGAPKAFKILMSGDDMGIELGPLSLNEKEVQKITQNMPAVYQLLPSAGYFSDILPDYKYYIDDMSDFDNDGIKGRLTYTESNQFLKNTGRNTEVLDSAVTLHDDIDNMNPADYSVQTYNIVGCGTPTLGKFFTYGKEADKDPEFGAAFITGDGTVPERSAEGVPSIEQYYDDKNADHGTMPSASGVKELVASLLSGTESDFDFGVHDNIATTSDKCKIPNGKILMFHSPVDVNIYDPEGDHTGPTASGTIEYSVPGIAYEIFENNKFVYLPDGEDYTVKLNATDIGSFSSHIQTVKNGDIVSAEYFNDIPLASTGTTAEVDLSDTVSTIALDSTGDGASIQTIDPSSQLSGDSLSDMTAPTTTLNIISPLSLSSDGTVLNDAQISFAATDTDSGVLKTEYSFDGINWTEYDGGTISTNEKSIQYYSVDNAGNIEYVQSSDIQIETEEIKKIQNIISAPIFGNPTGGSSAYVVPMVNIATETMPISNPSNTYKEIISDANGNIQKSTTEIGSLFTAGSKNLQKNTASSGINTEYSSVFNAEQEKSLKNWIIITMLFTVFGLFFLGRKYIKR